jgi:hypothetical protein
MRFSLLYPALVLVSAAWAADKKLPIEQTSNELVEISATALSKDEVARELGSGLDGEFVVVRVTFRPVSDKPLVISRDDFLLVSSKDGQRSEPFAPSQIAGSATLVVTPQGARDGGGVFGQGNGPIWGGIPGTGGAPQRLPGSGGGIGNGGATVETDNKVEVKKSDQKSDQENPLLAALTAKCLPEKKTTESVSGLLYFQMDGKLKPKDLELHYQSPAGKLALRFRP